MGLGPRSWLCFNTVWAPTLPITAERTQAQRCQVSPGHLAASLAAAPEDSFLG